MNLQDLPDETLLQIFSDLTIYDLHNRVAVVCKRFLRISRTKDAIKVIRALYTSKEKANRFFSNALTLNPNVESIATMDLE